MASASGLSPPEKETASGKPKHEETEEDALDFSTTVDPSFIIKLIRQLLPPVDMQKARTKVEAKDSEAAEHPMVEDKSVHDNMIDGARSSFLMEDHHGLGKATESNDRQELEKLVGAALQSSGTLEEEREEAGCMLWDLAASQAHAEFMVENHILDVLFEILNAPHVDRLREICLGIMGNLACHAAPVKAIVEIKGLQSLIVQCLFVDDAPSLSEACRLLSAGLHSEELDCWTEALRSQDVLERVMWIAVNTMNSLLLEKSTELLLAMVDCQGSTSSLAPVLVRLGLPSIVTDLLAQEVSGLKEGSCIHGTFVLDTLLQIAEALSLLDDIASELSKNSKLFTLACQVIQFSRIAEIGPAGISAIVLVANLLAENECLITQISNYSGLIQQLLELLPTTADDMGARDALWSILGRLSQSLERIAKDSQRFNLDVLLAFAERHQILLEDLHEYQDHQMESSDETHNTKGVQVKLEIMSRFLHIMEEWVALNDRVANDSAFKIIDKCCVLLKLDLKELNECTLSDDGNRLLSQDNLA